MSNINSVIATGWGQTGFDEAYSVGLQKIEIDLVSKKACSVFYFGNRKLPDGLTENMLCYGKFGANTCKGDSGGPIQVYSKNQFCPLSKMLSNYVIVGITSFGWSICDSSIPGIYTRISNYYNWIETNINATDNLIDLM